jgi:hypothetical protein
MFRWAGTAVELLFDPPGYVRISCADSEIIDRALVVQELAARPVTLVTYDTNISMRSRVAGRSVRGEDCDVRTSQVFDLRMGLDRWCDSWTRRPTPAAGTDESQQVARLTALFVRRELALPFDGIWGALPAKAILG